MTEGKTKSSGTVQNFRWTTLIRILFHKQIMKTYALSFKEKKEQEELSQRLRIHPTSYILRE
jgi:hypothetical protein